MKNLRNNTNYQLRYDNFIR